MQLSDGMIRSSVSHYKYCQLVLTLTSRLALRKTNISTSQLTTLIESHNTHFESLSTTIT